MRPVAETGLFVAKDSLNNEPLCRSNGLEFLEKPDPIRPQRTWQSSRGEDSITRSPSLLNLPPLWLPVRSSGCT